jgi:hypothetical protein
MISSLIRERNNPRRAAPCMLLPMRNGAADQSDSNSFLAKGFCGWLGLARNGVRASEASPSGVERQPKPWPVRAGIGFATSPCLPRCVSRELQVWGPAGRPSVPEACSHGSISLAVDRPPALLFRNRGESEARRRHLRSLHIQGRPESWPRAGSRVQPSTTGARP